MHNFPLRVPETLMQQAVAAAREDGASTNQMLLTLIAEGLGRRNAFRHMQERAARANPELAMQLLREFATEAPEPGDEMPEAPSSVRPAGM